MGGGGCIRHPCHLPTPMLALGSWLLRPLTSVVSVTEDQKEDRAGRLAHFRDGATAAKGEAIVAGCPWRDSGRTGLETGFLAVRLPEKQRPELSVLRHSGVCHWVHLSWSGGVRLGWRTLQL